MRKLRNMRFFSALLTKNGSNKAEIPAKKKSFRFGILPKLILGFMIPVAFIVILGVTSYTSASEGLLQNYEQATNNTFEMATEYLNM